MSEGRIANFQIDGTAALDADCNRLARPRIIAFPRAASEHVAALPCTPGNSLTSLLRAKIAEVLAASEMYCSLKFEDFRGCAYNAFSKRNMRVLSLSIAALAVAAIAFGA